MTSIIEQILKPTRLPNHRAIIRGHRSQPNPMVSPRLIIISRVKPLSHSHQRILSTLNRVEIQPVQVSIPRKPSHRGLQPHSNHSYLVRNQNQRRWEQVRRRLMVHIEGVPLEPLDRQEKTKHFRKVRAPRPSRNHVFIKTQCFLLAIFSCNFYMCNSWFFCMNIRDFPFDKPHRVTLSIFDVLT